MAPPELVAKRLVLTRTISAGDRVAAKRRNIARLGLGDAGHPGVLEPAPGVQVRPTWVGRHLHVGVLRTPARLVSYELAGGDLALEVDLDPHGMSWGGAPAPAAAEFVLVRHGGRAVQAFKAEVSRAGPVLRVHGLVPKAVWRRRYRRRP